MATESIPESSPRSPARGASPAGRAGPAPACPRCGYDLRGEPATWTDACPLRGTCTECGLAFEWGDLLGGEKLFPRWSVEGSGIGRPYLLRVVLSIVMTAAPWRFWGDYHLAARLRPGRLIAFVLVVLMIAPIAGYVGARWTLAHRARTVMLGAGATTDVSYAEAVAQSILTPWSEVSPGRRSVGMLRGPYPCPAALYDAIRAPVPRWIFVNFRVLGKVVAAAGLLHVLCPLAFIAAPITRRRCGVRWSHLARITLLGGTLLLPGIALASASYGVHVIDWRRSETLAEWSVVALLFAAPPLLLVWWASALRCYLHLPRPFVTAAVCLTLACLTFTVLFLKIVRPGDWTDLFEPLRFW